MGLKKVAENATEQQNDEVKHRTNILSENISDLEYQYLHKITPMV